MRTHRPTTFIVLFLTGLGGLAPPGLLACGGQDSTPDGGVPGADGQTTGDCPGSGGPAMRRVPGGYCIDTTEVTRDQYAEWLTSEPSPADQPGHCAWNDDFTPTCGWPPGSNGLLPVSCVDWCDAAAFCAGVGKRLCGAVGGGPAPLTAFADPEVSQWYRVCSADGANDYTYGDAHLPDACQSGDNDKWGTVAAASLDTCQSPDSDYAGVYDLTGNAMEWVDACDTTAGAEDECRLRGGSYNNIGTALRCDAGEALLFPRASKAHGVTFRCCAD